MKQISETKIRKAASMKQTMVMLTVALAIGTIREEILAGTLCWEYSVLN